MIWRGLRIVLPLLLACGCGRRPMAPPFFTCNPNTHQRCPEDMECKLVDHIYLCVPRPDVPLPECDPGEVRCNAIGSGVETCMEGRFVFTVSCGGDVPYCVDGECYMCPRGQRYCRGLDAWQCAPDGASTHHIERCNDAEAEICHNGECVNGCHWAAEQESHLGCHFVAVFAGATYAGSGAGGAFGVLVYNPGTWEAKVWVTRLSEPVASGTVQPAQWLTIGLDPDPALQPDPLTPRSALANAGAYAVGADAPVAVFQFGPKDFEAGRTAASSATMLIPSTLMSSRYRAITLPTTDPAIDPATHPAPGFIAVTPVDFDTQVTVTLSAHIAAGTDIPALGPGDTHVDYMEKGEVLFLLSSVDPAHRSQSDLTGTTVESENGVAVFAGHVCGSTGPNASVCGQMTEQLRPVSLWGTGHVLVPMAPSLIEAPPDNRFRIITDFPDNLLSFTPATIHAPVSLNPGEVVEVEAHEPFHLQSADPVLVAQFVPEKEWSAAGMAGPSFALPTPVDRYSTQFGFALPEHIDGALIAVITPFEQVSLVLDGQEFPWSNVLALNGSPFLVYWGEINLDYTATAHTLRAGAPVGLLLLGHNAPASFLTPGGWNSNF